MVSVAANYGCGYCLVPVPENSAYMRQEDGEEDTSGHQGRVERQHVKHTVYNTDQQLQSFTAQYLNVDCVIVSLLAPSRPFMPLLWFDHRPGLMDTVPVGIVTVNRITTLI